MFVSAGLETSLELVEVGRVSLVEVRSRHERRGLHLTLGHILNSIWEIVVVAVVGGTVGGVGEVSRVQFECGDGNSVDRVFPSLGEM